MTQFIQLHLLTSYPPANLNRDDSGHPKTAKMGGTDRLRVSSQCLKRTWRTSDLFQDSLAGHIGTRTKLLGINCYKRLTAGGVKEKQAIEWSKSIAGVFGALKKDDKDDPMKQLEIEQLVHVSPAEQTAIDGLVDTLIGEQRKPEDEELGLLRKDQTAVDISLFGRMLASKPNFNVEAACQVAHALSVHSIVIEDDYFTAVDDLNDGSEDLGAAHIGETGFAAGLFYAYICINKDLLLKNLGEQSDATAALRLANQSIAALLEAAAKVAPEGKQNSFASRAYASYILAEKGAQQPRSLSAAFLKAIDYHDGAEDFAATAIKALNAQRDSFDAVYGPCVDAHYQMDVVNKEGSFSELIHFVQD